MAILNIGASTFGRKGPALWRPSGRDLESVTINMQGPASALDAYLATLTQWSVCPLDSNLYLESWPNDEDKQYPTVSLNYIGRRGGTLPTVTTSKGSGLGTCPAVIVFSVEYTGLIYVIPSETTVTIATTAPSRPTSAGTAHPGSTAPFYGINFMTLANGGSNAGIIPYVLALLSVYEQIADFRSEELVPGHYWRVTQTKTWSLGR